MCEKCEAARELLDKAAEGIKSVLSPLLKPEEGDVAIILFSIKGAPNVIGVGSQAAKAEILSLYLTKEVLENGMRPDLAEMARMIRYADARDATLDTQDFGGMH